MRRSPRRVIVFGDSLTDLGTYTPATQIPLGQNPGAAALLRRQVHDQHLHGYTATNNTSNANIWVEWIAAAPGRARSRRPRSASSPRACRARRSARGLSVNTCTGYAQGGARVTDPNGIGKTSGALTIPMVEQIASHNTRT